MYLRRRYLKLAPKSFTQGFSMIELLVAMVVLAIGLLGMAGLQTAGLSNNQSAFFRSQASIAINDIIDRMRANNDGVTAGHYNTNFDTNGTIPSDPGCINTSSGCNPQQLSDFDKREWAKLFKKIDGTADPLLPNASGQLTFDAVTNMYSVSISWDETDWENNGSQVVKTRLKTQSMRVNIAL